MGKNIFITGGTGKIGGQLVAHFVTEGWQVVTTTRKAENLGKLVERGLLNGEEVKKISLIEVDFLHKEAIQKVLTFFESKKELYPHIIVNNARSLSTLGVEENGTSSRKKLLDEYLIDVVVPYELVMGLGYAKGSKLEKIINISSIYGLVPFNPNLYTNYPHSSPIQYSLAKAATLQLSKELAIRLADKSIQVNTVSYGGVKGRVDEAFLERYAKLCPEGVMLEEEQVIGPVAFLASDASKGITGQNIIQDGGWTTW